MRRRAELLGDCRRGWSKRRQAERGPQATPCQSSDCSAALSDLLLVPSMTIPWCGLAAATMAKVMYLISCGHPAFAVVLREDGCTLSVWLSGFTAVEWVREEVAARRPDHSGFRRPGPAPQIHRRS